METNDKDTNHTLRLRRTVRHKTSRYSALSLLYVCDQSKRRRQIRGEEEGEMVKERGWERGQVHGRISQMKSRTALAPLFWRTMWRHKTKSAVKQEHRPPISDLKNRANIDENRDKAQHRKTRSYWAIMRQRWLLLLQSILQSWHLNCH